MSEEQKHTPGPWRVWDRGPDEIVIVTDENEPWYIAELCDLDSSGDVILDGYNETLTNAHLIAAAPDLLEISQEMLEILERLDIDGCLQKQDGCQWEKWETAIDKAKEGK